MLVVFGDTSRGIFFEAPCLPPVLIVGGDDPVRAGLVSPDLQAVLVVLCGRVAACLVAPRFGAALVVGNISARGLSQRSRFLPMAVVLIDGRSALFVGSRLLPVLIV